MAAALGRPAAPPSLKTTAAATSSSASTQSKTAATIGAATASSATTKAATINDSTTETPSAPTAGGSSGGSPSAATKPPPPVGASSMVSLGLLLTSNLPTATASTAPKPTPSVPNASTASASGMTLPTTAPQGTSLTGFVYLDLSGSGVKEPGDCAVGGMLVTLHSTTYPNLVLLCQTGSNGAYAFNDLSPGTYTVSVPVLSELINASPTPGMFVDGSENTYALVGGQTIVSGSVPPTLSILPSDFGTSSMGSSEDVISGIVLGSDYSGMDFNFPALGATVIYKGNLLTSALETNTYWVNGATVTPGTPIVPAVAEPGTFVLLAGAALCGGLICRRRTKRRRRLVPAGTSCGVMGRARASPWWKLSCRGGPPPGNVGHAEFLTKSFNTIHSFLSLCNLSFKESVMKVVRIISVALTLLVLAMVSTSRAAEVVQFALQPIESGTTAYTITGGGISNGNVAAASVTTTSTSGTIYFDIWACLDGTNTNCADDGINQCNMGYWTTGTIGTAPTKLSLTSNSAFSGLATATTGTSQDINHDGNLDIGTTVTGSSSGTSSGWAITGDAAGSYTTGNGTVTSGGRTDILLGVLGYTYNGATVGQSATVTLAPPISVTTRFFYYELDGATGKSDSFYGASSADYSIVTAPTITYQSGNGTPGLSLSGTLTNSNRIMVSSKRSPHLHRHQYRIRRHGEPLYPEHQRDHRDYHPVLKHRRDPCCQRQHGNRQHELFVEHGGHSLDWGDGHGLRRQHPLGFAPGTAQRQRGQQPAADGQFDRSGRDAPERQLGLHRDRHGPRHAEHEADI